MELPDVGPSGTLERPVDPGAPRPASRRVRAFAALLLILFAFATVVTTVASLGAYCLTTEPGNVHTLPASLRGPVSPREGTP